MFDPMKISLASCQLLGCASLILKRRATQLQGQHRDEPGLDQSGPAACDSRSPASAASNLAAEDPHAGGAGRS